MTDRLFKNPKFSDITLVSKNGKEFPAHLNILSTFTDFFEMAISPKSGFSESSTHIISFPEHTSRTLEAFLGTCYCGFYVSIGIGDDVNNTVQHHMEVYKLAHFLMIEDLKALALRSLRELIVTETLDEVASNFWYEGLSELVDEVFGEGFDYEEIREIVLDYVVMGMVHGWHWSPLKEVGLKHLQFSSEFIMRYFSSNQQHRFVVNNYDDDGYFLCRVCKGES